MARGYSVDCEALSSATARHVEGTVWTARHRPPAVLGSERPLYQDFLARAQERVGIFLHQQ